MAEIFDGLADGSLDNVLAEYDTNAVARAEVVREAERFGDASFAFLIGVVEVGDSEPFAIDDQAWIPGVTATGDEQDFLGAKICKRLDRIVDYRLIVHRQEMFIGDFS